ncbi:MAG: TetR/AcrR family transcriptional regulator [Acidimicrobiales bacterium]
MAVVATGRGRPRSEVCDRAIAAAAVDALLTQGYEGMSVEGVAAAAGVGKTTIYRRFASKAELVVEALRQHTTQTMIDESPPDTGDVRADLLALWTATLADMAGVDGQLLAVFVSERARHAELAAELERVFVAQRRAHAHRLVRRGVANGQLPAGTDVELLADVGPALMWQRCSLGHAPLSAELPGRIIRQFFP